MAGPLLTMPILIINMGSEMIYILNQRLQAQKIDATKSVRVLCDVVKTMFNPKFVKELFKPQEIYSNPSTRKIFDRLAHSSIMRLNESSMDKLYDLMSMGVKYQTMSCSSPDMLLQVTLNHLHIIKQLAPSDEVFQLIDDTIMLTTKTYGQLTIGNFQQIKHFVLQFFQDRRVKVSLFLQQGLQNLDGTIVIRNEGVVTNGGDVPGAIRYFDANGREFHTEEIDMESANGVEPNTTKNILDRSLEECPYGKNMYDSTSATSAPKQTPVELLAGSKGNLAAGSKGGTLKTSPRKRKVTATDELNLLANLMGSSVKEGEKDSKPFKINLFASDPFDFSDSGGGAEEGNVRTIVIDGTSDHKSARTLLKDFDSKEPAVAEQKGTRGNDDDLLSLMDST